MNLNTETNLASAIKIITCPEEQQTPANTLFLAGGISNCPDWQSEIIKLMREYSITVLNPRRDSFDISDPTATDFQIAWEHRHLHLAEAISFWFPKETECPITLFELGYWLLSAKPLAIGLDPDYPRIQELFAQLLIHRPDLQIATTLKSLTINIAKLSKAPLIIPKYQIQTNDFFLAGGISNCPNWQEEVSQLLINQGLEVFNPRKADFIGMGGMNYRNHLRKNHQRLIDSKAVVFWFAKETLNSMALFELGIACQLNKPIFIGVEPGYTREQDIRVQVGLARPDVKVVNTIQELTSQVVNFNR